jgi:hypothetical protein
MQNIKSGHSYPEASMFNAREPDHRQIFLDAIESNVRARGMSKAFGLGSGLLMRLNTSTLAQDAMEDAIADHLRSVRGVAFGETGRTPHSYVLDSLLKTRGEWWLVTFPMSREMRDIRAGDIYFSAQLVADAFEDFQNEGYAMSAAPVLARGIDD